MPSDPWTYAGEWNGFVRWFIVECLGRLPDKKVGDIVKAENQVELLFNGHPLPFAETVAFMGQQFDECVLKQAQELVREKFAGVVDALDGVKERVVGHMTSLLDSAGIPRSEE